MSAPDVSWANLPFARQELKTTLGNLSIAGRRNVAAYLATAKNSGTHWLQFMLSHAIAHHYGKPPPGRSTGEQRQDFISNPKLPQRYPDLPLIAQTHKIPSALLATRWVRALVPPTAVLVRDIRQAMLSNYVKWRDDYGTSLSEYVRGAPQGKRFVADVWWFVLFFNRWGALAEAAPDRVIVVRYEDVQADPAAQVRRIAAHWGIALDDAAVAAAVAVAGRDVIRARQDAAFGQTIVPSESERASVRFSPEDDRFIDAVFARYLRYNLGYPYPVRAR